MKLPSIIKHHSSTQQSKKRLSSILSKTRIRTSKIVKFRKHMGQILRERIPVIAPLQELISWKGLISEVSIIPYSPSRRWRVIIIVTEWIFGFILIFYGNNIITEAKRNIWNILFHFKFPHHISIHTVILMIVMCIWTIGYYGMIKPWDFKQAIKEHKEEYEER